MEKLLVIDEDTSHCRLMGQYLEANGFCVETQQNAPFPDETWANQYAAVILELMLSQGNGYDILRELRSKSSIPIVLTAAQDEVFDPIIGLELGADDYLRKPFHPRELLARIRAILRRTRNNIGENSADLQQLQIGDIKLDLKRRTVCRSDRVVNLTAVEFKLLEILLRAGDRVVTRAEIATQVLGRGLHAHDRSIDMHISRLRKKLQDQERIRTVRSVGYIFGHSTE